MATILASWGDGRGMAQGGEKEPLSELLPGGVLTPQLDTEPAAFRLRHITQGQIREHSSTRSPKLVCTVRILQHDREPRSECPFFVASE